MNNNLSANTLFHFTKNKENLLSILKNGFFPKYSLEENFFIKKGNNNGWAVPMVCFCDIPLSQIKNHVKKYGGYAIGLTKKWGMKKGLSPILYTHPKSLLTKEKQNLFSYIHNTLNNQVHNTLNNQDNMQPIWESYLYTTFFIKPYNGSISIKDIKKKKRIRFYDEREWRYVPSMPYSDKKQIISFLSDIEYEDKNFLNGKNLMLEKEQSLKFRPEDIKYLIVSKESEILEFLDDVLNIKMDNGFLRDDLKLLTTRIISIEQIMQDF